MKKEITVIRESIGKVVNLLTGKAINVTQRGFQASVQYHPTTGAIMGVNLPFIPDDASEEFIGAVQGFLDHEVGHVLHTDPKAVIAAAKKGGRVKNVANTLEDVFIERKMTEAFRGSVGNLESVRRFHIDKVALPEIKSALAAGDKEKAAGYVGVLQFRAWGGQTAAVDFLKDNPSYAALFNKTAEKMGPDLIARVGKLKSSDDCLKLAIDIVKAITPPPPPPAPPAPPMAPPEKSEEGEPKPGESSGEEPPPEPEGDGGETAPPDDEGTTTTEADDSDKKRDETSKTDEKGEAGGDVEGDDDGKEETDEECDATSTSAADDIDDEAEGEAPESGAGEPADDTSEPDDGEGEGEGELADDAGEEPDDEPAGMGTAGDEDEGEGEDDGATGEEGGESDEAGEGAESEDGEASDTAGHHLDMDDRDTTADESDEDVGSPFDAEHDFDTEASKALGTAAYAELSSAEYRVFSNEWDKIDQAPQARRPESVDSMVDAVEHMVAGIQKQLERAMAAKDKVVWNPGQRRGRISPGALFRTAVGDDRVFRTRYESKAKNVAVSLLVDCSGSMAWSDRIGTAGKAAYALSSTLERLKIQHEVLGFTTKKSSTMLAAMKAESRIMGYSRLEALYLPVFKSFSERLTTAAKSRIAHLTERPGWLRENVDGESLQMAAHRLRSQKAERHVLIVLSDGSPACSGSGHALDRHLHKSVKDLEASGVEVIGIGIETDSVRRYYKNSMVLNNLEELPTTLVGQLAKVLLAP